MNPCSLSSIQRSVEGIVLYIDKILTKMTFYTEQLGNISLKIKSLIYLLQLDEPRTGRQYKNKVTSQVLPITLIKTSNPDGYVFENYSE